MAVRRQQLWGLTKQLERLKIFEMHSRKIPREEIATELGMSVALVNKDLMIVRKELKKGRIKELNLYFNRNLIRIEGMINDLYDRLRNVAEDTQVTVFADIYEKILKLLQEEHKLLGAYQQPEAGSEDIGRIPMLVINYGDNIQLNQLKAPQSVEVPGEVRLLGGDNGDTQPVEITQ